MILFILRVWAFWSFWFIIIWDTCVLCTCEYHSLMIYNTSPSLLVSVLRNFYFFNIMFKMTWKELSTVHHFCKADLILSSDFLTMYYYSCYIADDVNCIVSDVFNSYTLYYWHNWLCDLVLSTLELTHTLCEKEWVNSELLTAEIKTIQL